MAHAWTKARRGPPVWGCLAQLGERGFSNKPYTRMASNWVGSAGAMTATGPVTLGALPNGYPFLGDIDEVTHLRKPLDFDCLLSILSETTLKS